MPTTRPSRSWDSIRPPLAAALHGGPSIRLYRRRGGRATRRDDSPPKASRYLTLLWVEISRYRNNNVTLFRRGLSRAASCAPGTGDSSARPLRTYAPATLPTDGTRARVAACGSRRFRRAPPGVARFAISTDSRARAHQRIGSYG